MSIQSSLLTTWQESQQPAFDPSTDDLVSLLDLTLLDKSASAEEINALSAKAQQHHVASVCVFPQHLKLLPTNLCRTTVVNFPTGNEPLKQVLQAIKNSIHDDAVDEVDYVFPYQAYLEGDRSSALDHCKNAYYLCKEHGITFKVILETGAFPTLEALYEVSLAILNQGCDFLKTSTGKIPVGATVPAAFSMLSALRDTQSVCGIKISGGIKTKEQSLEYIRLAEYMLSKHVDKHWFRLGGSSLLDDLLSPT